MSAGRGIKCASTESLLTMLVLNVCVISVVLSVRINNDASGAHTLAYNDRGPTKTFSSKDLHNVLSKLAMA